MEIINRIIFRLKHQGLVNLIQKGFQKLGNAIIPGRINRCNFYIKEFKNKTGLEIGGPSNVFLKKSAIPIYSQVKSLDNLDFSNQTIWHDKSSNLFTVNNFESIILFNIVPGPIDCNWLLSPNIINEHLK